MTQRKPPKELLDGYVGVKFDVVKRSETLPADSARFVALFGRVGDRLREHDMTPANGGNMSVRFQAGFVITASGCNLGRIEEAELIFAERCDVVTQKVCFHGSEPPSSETLMHWLIYQDRPEAGAVIHAHDELATRPELLKGEIEESTREEPYGTVELARMAIDTFRGTERIIVLKNHGYVAVGSDLESTCDLVVKTHLRLLAKHSPAQ